MRLGMQAKYFMILKYIVDILKVFKHSWVSVLTTTTVSGQTLLCKNKTSFVGFEILTMTSVVF
jgi:hypothetical protein